MTVLKISVVWDQCFINNFTMNEKKNIYLIFLTFNNDTIVPLVVGLAVWTALLYFNKRS